MCTSLQGWQPALPVSATDSCGVRQVYGLGLAPSSLLNKGRHAAHRTLEGKSDARCQQHCPGTQAPCCAPQAGA